MRTVESMQSHVVAVERACKRESELECSSTANGLVRGRRSATERTREERQTFGELRQGTIAKLVDMLGAQSGLSALTPASKFLDVGCGFGQVVMEVSLLIPGLRCVGMELVPSHIRGARRALRSLRRDGIPLPDVVLHEGGACALLEQSCEHFSHVYAFDLCFEEETLRGVAEALRSMPFSVLVSFHRAEAWGRRGLRVRQVGAIRPACMTRTREKHALYILAREGGPEARLEEMQVARLPRYTLSL